MKPETKKPTSVLKHPIAVMAYLLVVLWVIVPNLPDETGFRMGFGFQAFYSLFVVLGTAIVLFLRKDTMRAPSSQGGALLSIGLVFVVVLGFVTLIGTVYPYPQLEVPTLEAMAAEEGLGGAELGKKLFFGEGDLTPSCSMCHRWEGTGGDRGPELTDVKDRAGSRVAGTAAEDYVRNHILKGSAYHTIEGFPAMMPPFEGNITDEQLDAILALLLGEGGN